MHTMRFIALCLAVSSPLLANAALSNVVQDERAIREECSAHSQAGMRDCLAKKANESEKALKHVENKVNSALFKWDEDAKYIGLAKARLAASNKEFAKYREAQCEFLASLSGGAAGNAHEIGHLACVAELNNRRAEQLRNAVIDLPLR